MSVMKRGGAWVPCPLALDADKRVMEKWQRLLMRCYLASGAAVVIPGAHTGEFAGGDLDLFERLLVWTREATEAYGGAQTFLMAALSGDRALKQAELAARHGYDVVMVAPTALSGLDDRALMRRWREIASIIPTFAFELQRAIPGAREFSDSLWDDIFSVACGAKGASFDTYRSLRMLRAAARNDRRDDLVLATGNDDRIVSDLGGRFPFEVRGRTVTMKYHAGLLGHLATDTHAGVQWVRAVQSARDGGPWTPSIPREELAHRVNVCNAALVDAFGNFENSVWGVKRRLADLGLLPAPICFHERGRPGQAEAIAAAYDAHPALGDTAWVRENLAAWKRDVGARPIRAA